MTSIQWGLFAAATAAGLITLAEPANAAGTCKGEACVNVPGPSAEASARSAVTAVRDVELTAQPLPPLAIVPAWQPLPPLVSAPAMDVAPLAISTANMDWLLPAGLVVGAGLCALFCFGGNADSNPSAPQEVPPVIVNPPGEVLAIPEPATWAMMLMGFAAIGAVVRRKLVKEKVRGDGPAENYEVLHEGHDQQLDVRLGHVLCHAVVGQAGAPGGRPHPILRSQNVQPHDGHGQGQPRPEGVPPRYGRPHPENEHNYGHLTPLPNRVALVYRPARPASRGAGTDSPNNARPARQVKA